MNRLYSLMAALLLSASTLSAQNVTSRDFNDIKRSKQYFYYDITMGKEDEAKNAANVNLAKLINDYCVENSITNVKVKDTDLKNVKYLKMDKNGMVRILAYVEKATYIGESKAVESSAAVDKKPQKEIVAVVKIEQKPEKKTEQKPEQKKVLPPSSHPSAEASSVMSTPEKFISLLEVFASLMAVNNDDICCSIFVFNDPSSIPSENSKLTFCACAAVRTNNPTNKQNIFFIFFSYLDN